MSMTRIKNNIMCYKCRWKRIVFLFGKMSTVVSSSSDCVDNTACRLRRLGSGTSLHTTRTVTTPPTTLNNNAISSTGSRPNVINNSSASNKQYCFHWCCCCRPCSCLGVKSVQEEPKSRGEEEKSLEELLFTAPDEPLPPFEEIRSWSQGFDKLMKSPGGRKIFRYFLRCEYSEENISFWEACESLKNETNPTAIEEKARVIYEDFISILSPKEVSLDSRVRDLINMRMTAPDAHTYDEAQTQIYTLMQRDSYPRFVCWDKYKKLLNHPPDPLTPSSPLTDDNESPKNSSKSSSKESTSRSSSVRRKKYET